MATAAEPKVVKTPEDHEKDTRVVERDRRVRLSVMAKVVTKNAAKVDIRPLGGNRFRVNVWAETGTKTEGGFFAERRIVESFYHIL